MDSKPPAIDKSGGKKNAPTTNIPIRQRFEPPPETVNQADLPFLVTHWLAHFGENDGQNDAKPEQQAALKRIRHAASEIASAFASLGSYGISRRVSCLCSESSHTLLHPF